MAPGDVVSGISGDNTQLNFQPAAGVECIITSAFLKNQSNLNKLRITDGTNETEAGSFSQHALSIKIFINNTNYLRIDNLGAGSGRSGYTGLQIK